MNEIGFVNDITKLDALDQSVFTHIGNCLSELEAESSKKELKAMKKRGPRRSGK